MKTATFSTKVLTILAASALTACAGYGRPEMTSLPGSISEMTQAQQQVPTSPMAMQPQAQANAGSLWRQGSKQFFRDSRARQVGDIVTVLVTENAKAEVEANTESTRRYQADSALPELLGLPNRLLVPRSINPANLMNADSNRDFTGEAKTDREDKLQGRIAAVVTQMLPNGYMVIQGRREVMVNYELQDMRIQGIIRPEDISADNTIQSEKIAEARITYAGRGLIDEAQQPQSGNRFLDKWMPF